MRLAVYPSVLYGSDFIVESIESILPHVDAVVVVMMDRPWGDTRGVEYRGEWITWPARFDNTREKLAQLKSALAQQDVYRWSVEVVEAYKLSPVNRWGFGVERALERMKGAATPTEIMLIDPDCVFSDAEANRVFRDWDEHPEYQWAAPGQIELWRTPEWQVVRPRSMTSLHRGDLSLLVSNTEQTRPKTHALAGRVHNLGFCCSEQNTLWKHLTSMAFSPVVGESLPNPDWYEEKWRKWRPGVRDLEPSIRCESAIPEAVPYDTSGLPESIKSRLAAGEWPRFESAR